MAPNTTVQSTSGKEEPKWVRFVTGGLASMTAEAATLPVDVTKIRLQLQGQPGAPKLYNGMLDCMKKVIEMEGVGGLYKGLTPGLLRQASYSSLRMGVYEPIRNFVSGDDKNPPFYKKVLAGGSAGAFGALIANPTDLIKIRMQADIAGTRYKHTLDAFQSIIKDEGFFGMWKGCTPNIQRAIIVNAAELATYDQAKTLYLGLGISEGVFNHFLSSFTAGFVAACVSSPVDVMKTRLMSQKSGADRVYTGMVDCFVKTVKAEGFMALYKGFIPNWLRIGPWCVVMFMTYEQYRNFARRFWDK
eukprot:GILI01010038.1.p1 GENE.GILI01010038.1~~GILI01010038.1.p1  ORF type:complete len:302 (-),score=100.51 GILI01010038.1:184-1089(-)